MAGITTWMQRYAINNSFYDMTKRTIVNFIEIIVITCNISRISTMRIGTISSAGMAIFTIHCATAVNNGKGGKYICF